MEDEELCQAVIFTTVSREGPTREGLAKVFVWQNVVFCFTKSLLTLYILSLPTNCKEWFLEKKP